MTLFDNIRSVVMYKPQ